MTTVVDTACGYAALSLMPPDAAVLSMLATMMAARGAAAGRGTVCLTDERPGASPRGTRLLGARADGAG